MSDLFTIEPSLSPRLAWMEKHRIQTKHAGFGPAVHTQWTAWRNCEIYDHPHDGNAAEGETEDEAIVALAQKLGLKLWNEEQA